MTSEKTCPEFDKYGLLYQSGELGTEEQSRFENHLGECAFCRDEISLITETLKLYPRLGGVNLMPSAECEKHIKEIIKVPATVQRMSLWHYIAWAGVSAAAVLVLTFGRFLPKKQESITIPLKMVQKTPKLQWSNGLDKEIARLKYEIAYLKYETFTTQTTWDIQIEKLKESIKGLNEEIDKM